jgi:5'-3' exonuclease
VQTGPVKVHLIDGTYELFRQHFGQPPRSAADGSSVAATRGVLLSTLLLLESGATHVGVATDHVIESFRNDLWPTYKTGEGIDPDLAAQFGLLETALDAMGVLVWPMVALEADDALASAAHALRREQGVTQILICTPDKDLAQCVEAKRIVQWDRRQNLFIDEAAVVEKYGVSPESIPDWLALVGDTADGFPGLSGWGKRSAAQVLAHYCHLGNIPDDVAAWDPAVRAGVRSAARLAGTLAVQRQQAELFCDLATLRHDPDLPTSLDALRWRGPKPEFAAICAHLADPTLEGRARRAASR